jgi:hypothetical protein
MEHWQLKELRQLEAIETDAILANSSGITLLSFYRDRKVPNSSNAAAIETRLVYSVVVFVGLGRLLSTANEY